MAARERRLWEIEAHPTPDAQPEQKMTANQGARAEVQTRDFLRQILPKSTRLLEIT
jgi:DNA-binding TFAR19-related protein (PDSD5 family)